MLREELVHTTKEVRVLTEDLLDLCNDLANVLRLVVGVQGVEEIAIHLIISRLFDHFDKGNSRITL